MDDPPLDRQEQQGHDTNPIIGQQEPNEPQSQPSFNDEIMKENILKVMKENFSATLEESLTDMSESLKGIIQTLINDAIQTKLDTEVQNIFN